MIQDRDPYFTVNQNPEVNLLRAQSPIVELGLQVMHKVVHLRTMNRSHLCAVECFLLQDIQSGVSGASLASPGVTC